jgi:hypothetical protein
MKLFRYRRQVLVNQEVSVAAPNASVAADILNEGVTWRYVGGNLVTQGPALVFSEAADEISEQGQILDDQQLSDSF